MGSGPSLSYASFLGPMCPFRLRHPRLQPYVALFGSVAFLVNKPYRGAPSSRVRRSAAMRTAIATHELLPEGLYLESLSIETGRVSISAASETRRSRCPLCGRGSSRVHSRYSRSVSDLPWHGITVELEAFLLRRGIVRAAYLLRETAGRRRPRPQDGPVGGSAPGDRLRVGRARRRKVGRGARPRGRSRRSAPEGEKRTATGRREGEVVGRG